MDHDNQSLLDQLARTAAEYAAVNERLARDFERCVKAGHSDSAIARALGVSRQATCKRRLKMGLERVEKDG